MSNEALDIEKLSFTEACDALKKALQHRYPTCGYMYFGFEPIASGRGYTAINGGWGDQKTLETAGTDIVLRSRSAENFVHDVFLNYMLSIDKSEFKTEASRSLHDAILDYADSRHVDTGGIERFYKKQSREKQQNVVMDTEAVASRIKMLEDEIKSLKRELDPGKEVAVIKAIAKRMRRAGDIAGAAKKEAEVQAILDREQRKRENKQKRIENCRLAREAKVRNKQKREQAERDRQKAQQQFNPHKAAKAKMQKIRERQAERAASKKKASESKAWLNRPIQQVVANM